MGPHAPCLCLVLSCSLSDSSVPCEYESHLRPPHGSPQEVRGAVELTLEIGIGVAEAPCSAPSLNWERSLSLVHFLSKLTKESSEVPGAGSWSSPKGPPQGLPGSLIIGLLGWRF